MGPFATRSGGTTRWGKGRGSSAVQALRKAVKERRDVRQGMKGEGRSGDRKLGPDKSAGKGGSCPVSMDEDGVDEKMDKLAKLF